MGMTSLSKVHEAHPPYPLEPGVPHIFARGRPTGPPLRHTTHQVRVSGADCSRRWRPFGKRQRGGFASSSSPSEMDGEPDNDFWEGSKAPARSGRSLLGPAFRDPETERAYRIHRFALWGPRIRARLGVVCVLSVVAAAGRLVGDRNLGDSEQSVFYIILNFMPPFLWVAFTAITGQRALFTADNYERIVFGFVLFNIALRGLVFRRQSGFELRDLTETWFIPAELQVAFASVSFLTRVVLFYLCALFLLGLQPNAALVVSVADAASSFARRSQIFLALPAIGPVPAWAAFAFGMSINLGVIFVCAHHHADLEERAFLLLQALQKAKNERIEQLHVEKERLQYGATTARSCHTRHPTPAVLTRVLALCRVPDYALAAARSQKSPTPNLRDDRGEGSEDGWRDAPAFAHSVGTGSSRTVSELARAMYERPHAGGEVADPFLRDRGSPDADEVLDPFLRHRGSPSPSPEHSPTMLNMHRQGIGMRLRHHSM